MFDRAPSVDPAPNYGTVAPTPQEWYQVYVTVRNCMMYYLIFVAVDRCVDVGRFPILDGSISTEGIVLFGVLFGILFFVLPMTYLLRKYDTLSLQALRLLLTIGLFQCILAYFVWSAFSAKVWSRHYEDFTDKYREIATNFQGISADCHEQICHVQDTATNFQKMAAEANEQLCHANEIATKFQGMAADANEQLRRTHEIATNFEGLAKECEDRLNGVLDFIHRPSPPAVCT